MTTGAAAASLVAANKLLAESTFHVSENYRWIAPLPNLERIFAGYQAFYDADIMPGTLYIHPDDVFDFLDYIRPVSRVQKLAWDEETVEFFKSEGVLGYLHGVAILRWGGVPRRSFMLSGEYDDNWPKQPTFPLSMQNYMTVLGVKHDGFFVPGEWNTIGYYRYSFPGPDESEAE